MRSILGPESLQLTLEQKWNLLSPHLTQHGREALSYATLQAGMEYFVHDRGYLSFTTALHPVFARKPKRIVLADPVCAAEDLRTLIMDFLKVHPAAVFGVVSESCARLLRELGFKVNCVGYEPELDIQSYNTQGNWKELDMIKRARNEAKREGITIREVKIEDIPVDQLQALSSRWIQGKKVSDREIRVYARPAVYATEPGVRKFVAFDREGTAIGYVFYDPIHSGGRVNGYSANTVRCDEQRYGRLATAIHMTAMDIFKAEGVETLNLCLCPFTGLEKGSFHDDLMTKWFFQLSEKYGGELYNFKGLNFHKSKYRGREKPLYYASNSTFPSNDIYLAFLTSDIAKGYFTTMGLLGKGMFKAWLGPQKKAASSAG